MPNRKRWYTEVVGVFLLWVEEVLSDDSMHGPWKSKALRRFWTKYREIPEGVAQVATD